MTRRLQNEFLASEDYYRFLVESCLVEAGLSPMSLNSFICRARLNRCLSVLEVVT